jgi:transcriptional regulator with XRE-family HTH domain
VARVKESMHEKLKRKRPDLAIRVDAYKKMLGKYMEAKRKEKDYMVTEVLEGASISMRQLTAIEDGTSAYEFDTLLRYCIFVGVPLPFALYTEWEKDYKQPEEVSDDDVYRPGEVDFDIQIPEDE